MVIPVSPVFIRACERSAAERTIALRFSRNPLNAVTIRRVERGRLLIGEETYEATVGLTADRVISDALPSSLGAMSTETLAPLLDARPEMLVVGSGWSAALPPRELTFELAKRGLGMEVMDTPAACRTFNILIGEGRRPAALLFMD